MKKNIIKTLVVLFILFLMILGGVLSKKSSQLHEKWRVTKKGSLLKGDLKCSMFAQIRGTFFYNCKFINIPLNPNQIPYKGHTFSSLTKLTKENLAIQKHILIKDLTLSFRYSYELKCVFNPFTNVKVDNFLNQKHNCLTNSEEWLSYIKKNN